MPYNKDEILSRLAVRHAPEVPLDGQRIPWPVVVKEASVRGNIYAPAKTKIKTRATLAVTFAKEEQPAREAGSDEDPAAPPKIALKSESLRIFTRMFPAEGENATELSHC
jgi:hypothetical protein